MQEGKTGCATCAKYQPSRIQTLAWAPLQCPSKQASCLVAQASGLCVLGFEGTGSTLGEEMGEQTGKAHLSNPIRLFYCHMVLLGPGKAFWTWGNGIGR